MPAVVGHEGTGIVEEVAPGVDYVKPGDRVIISWPTCGTCPKCLVGRLDLCEMQFPLNFGGRRADGTQTIKLKGESIHGSYFQQSSFATHVDRAGQQPGQGGRRHPGRSPGGHALRHHDRRGLGDQRVRRRAQGRPGGVRRRGGGAERHHGGEDLRGLPAGGRRRASAAPANWRKELGATHVFNAREDDVVARLAELRPAGFKYAIDTSAKQSSITTAAQVPGDRWGLRRGGRARSRRSRTSPSPPSCSPRASACSSSWPGRPRRGSSSRR